MDDSSRIRVLIVDDHAVVRMGLGKLGLASRTQAALWTVEHKLAEPAR